MDTSASANTVVSSPVTPETNGITNDQSSSPPAVLTSTSWSSSSSSATVPVTDHNTIAIKRKRYLKSEDELDGSNNSRKIYKAYDSEEGVEVAMHRILPSSGNCSSGTHKGKSTNASNDNRIRLHDLEHDHLIKILDSWTEDDGSIIYITPIVTAGTLAMYITRIDEVRFRVVRKWCRQILSGLHYMHHKGTAHGDLRLSNIYINGETGNVLLGNFVIGQTYDSSSLVRILRYTAPENSSIPVPSVDNSTENSVFPIDNCVAASPPQDVYAFGMCVLEMVTRRIPWAKLVNTPNELMIIMNAKTEGIVPPELEELEAKYSANSSTVSPTVSTNGNTTVGAVSSSLTTGAGNNTGTTVAPSAENSITTTNDNTGTNNAATTVSTVPVPTTTVTTTAVTSAASAAATAALTKAEDARAAADLIRKCLAVNPNDRPTVEALLDHEFLRERKDEQEDRARDRKAATTTVPATVTATVPSSTSAVAPVPVVPNPTTTPVTVVPNPTTVSVPTTIAPNTTVPVPESTLPSTTPVPAVEIHNNSATNHPQYSVTPSSNEETGTNTVTTTTSSTTAANPPPPSTILGTVTSVTLTQVAIPTPIVSTASSVSTASVSKSSPVKSAIINNNGTITANPSPQTVTTPNPLGTNITITTSSSTIPTPAPSTVNESTNVSSVSEPISTSLPSAPSTLNATVSTSVTTNPIVTTSSTVVPSVPSANRSFVSGASGSVATISSVSTSTNPHASSSNPIGSAPPSQTTVVNKNGHSYVVTTTSIPQTPVTTPQTNTKSNSTNPAPSSSTAPSSSKQPSVTNLQPLKLLGLILETIRFISTKQILVSMRLVHPHPRRPETDVLCRYVKFEMNRTDPTDTPAQVAVELVGARLVPMDDMDKAIALLNASLGGILSIPTIYGPEALQSLQDRDYGGSHGSNYYTRRSYRSRGHTGSVSEGILEDDDQDNDHSDDEEDDGDDDHVTEGGAETETHDGRTVGELEDDAQEDEPEIDGDDARSHPSHGAASGGTNPRSVPGRSTRASSLAHPLSGNHYDDERGSVVTDKDSVRGSSQRGGIRSSIETKASPSDSSSVHGSSGNHRQQRQLNISSLSGSQLHRSALKIDQPMLIDNSVHNRTHDRTDNNDNESVSATPYTNGIRSRSASDARGLHISKGGNDMDDDNNDDDDDQLLANDEDIHAVRVTDDDFLSLGGSVHTTNNRNTNTNNNNNVPITHASRSDNSNGEHDNNGIVHHPSHPQYHHTSSQPVLTVNSPVTHVNHRPTVPMNNNTLSRSSTLSAQDSGWSTAHDVPFTPNDISLSLASTLSPIRGRGRTGTSDSINIPSSDTVSATSNKGTTHNNHSNHGNSGNHPPIHPNSNNTNPNNGTNPLIGTVSASGSARSLLGQPSSQPQPSTNGTNTGNGHTKGHTGSSRDPSPSAPIVRSVVPVTNDPTLSVKRQNALEDDPFAYLLSSPLIPRTNNGGGNMHASSTSIVSNNGSNTNGTGGAAGVLRTTVPPPSMVGIGHTVPSNHHQQPLFPTNNSSSSGVVSSSSSLAMNSTTSTGLGGMGGMPTGVSGYIPPSLPSTNGTAVPSFLPTSTVPMNNNNNVPLNMLPTMMTTTATTSTMTTNLTNTSLSSTALPVSDLEQLFELSNSNNAAVNNIVWTPSEDFIYHHFYILNIRMIGVLALQGAFLEHLAKFAELGVPAKEIRTPNDLASCDGLVIPGGESTAMGLIAERLGMLIPLKEWVQAKKPTWGTCAGMILVAESAEGTKTGGQTLLGGMPIAVHRNYFGSQLASFEAPLELEDPVVRSSVIGSNSSSSNGTFTGVFIRAPAILRVGEGVTPIAWVNRPHRDANVPDLPILSSTLSSTSSSSSESTSNHRVIVAARNPTFLVTAFHPELTESPGFHRLFAEQVEQCSGKKLLNTVHTLQGLDVIIPLTGTTNTNTTNNNPGSTVEGNNNEQQALDMTSRGNSGSLLIARRVVHGTPMH